LGYTKVVWVFDRVRVGTEACMWSSWVGEWAWLVLDLRMVSLHPTRHNTICTEAKLPPPHP
jgi:hypothetical protein